MIRIDSLCYCYPNSSISALDNVSMQIDAGEFLILAGPSGSGKSTLLRSLNGLVPHFSGGVVHGSVIVNGIDVIEAGPRKLSQLVGFVTQNPENQALLDRVESEIAFALENAAIPAQEMRVRVEEVLDLMDLTPLRDRSISTLSGGERQRVAIASVLALRPQILLLDEPTSQLDPQSAEKVLLSLVRLNEDLGLTILVAEHRLERVLRYADRLIYMENGRILVDDAVRSAISAVPLVPPLVQLAHELDWTPLPLTVKEGRRFTKSSNAHLPSNTSEQKNTKKPPVNVKPMVLQASNVKFSYNGTPVLNGIDLQVQKGEAVALMGRNGSGKSTFLRCIIGLHQQSEGTIEIDGLSIQGRTVAELAQNVAYLPQNPDDLLFAETVSDELQITLANHGMSGDERINTLLSELGLAEERDSYPRDLSTGQRQRVAMGAVTITQPSLLLLDEPTRGLDNQTKDKLVDIWRRWLTNGMALILVTHDVELAAKIADRVVILSQGEIIASGRSNDVLKASPLFAPQVARLFPDQEWLTVEDALDALNDETPH